MRFFSFVLVLLLGTLLPAVLVCAWEAFHAKTGFLASLPDYFAGPTEISIMIITQIELLVLLAVGSFFILRRRSGVLQITMIGFLLLSHVVLAAIVMDVRLNGGWQRLFFLFPWYNFVE